ncbi:MAG: transposase [Deltaproteobacteria bacterium]|nr:transposase [Deltaproteobacteria bacterium]
MCAQAVSEYKPRKPESGILHRLVSTHFDEFVESFEDADSCESGLPTFVRKEFEEFLDCGILERGFVLLFCDRCQREHALAFSCKGRAICPSCGARRMQETAAHLVDDVLPDVALRQYVLSPPFELRGLLACKREVLAKMVNFFVRAIFEQLTTWARCQGLAEPKCGAVTFIQRFTKTLNISPHLHVLVLDGVFANEEDGPRFVECPAPTNRDLLSLAQTVFKKMEKFLAKSGYLRSDSDALEEASLTPLERWYVRGLAEPSMLSPSRIVDVKSTAIECGGFSVHAQVRVAQGDRRGRERLCLYAARPPFAEDQLRMSGDGRVRLTLRRPAKNGQGAIVLSPVQFLRRLAWLVPPRRSIRFATRAFWLRPRKCGARLFQGPHPLFSSPSRSRT